MVDTGENVTNVELVYAGQEVEITETSASFYNQRQKVQVTLDKLLLCQRGTDRLPAD